MPNDFIDAIDLRINQKVKNPFDEGVIVSVTPRYARVQLKGTLRAVTAFYDAGNQLEVGKRCLVARVNGRYVITSSFSDRTTVITNRERSDFEFAPPSNVTATSIPGGVLVSWDTPVNQIVSFEVQTNTVEDDEGATTIITTRGSETIVLTGDDNYYRVRSVSSDYLFSSWSIWVLGEAGEPSGGGGSISVTDGGTTVDPATSIVFPDATVTDLGDGIAQVETGSGGGSPDATEVTFTPSDDTDWDVVPSYVQEAVDEVADRVRAIEATGGSTLRMFVGGKEMLGFSGLTDITTFDETRIDEGGLYSDINNRLEAPEDGIYRLSGRVRVELTEAPQTGYLDVQIEFFDSSDNTVSLLWQEVMYVSDLTSERTMRSHTFCPVSYLPAGGYPRIRISETSNKDLNVDLIVQFELVRAITIA